MGRYQLRYGDGYATIVKPTWNTNELSIVDEGVMIEANVTLKPRGSGPLSKVQNLPQAIIPAKLKEIGMDLYIETVGPATAENGSEGEGVGLFPMTQTPFPVDETKTNILFVKEHSQFNGVVDTFSIEKKATGAAAPIAVGAGDSTAAKAVLGKKRKEIPTVTEDADTTTATKEGGDKTAKKKKMDKTNKDNSASNIKTKKAAKTANNELPSAVSTSPQKSTAKTPQKKKAAAAASANNKTVDQVEQASAKKSPTKKKVAVSATKKAVDQVEMSAEAAKISTTAGGEDHGNDDKNTKEEKSGKEEKALKIKRPPNGYITFASHVRPKIMEENPGLKVTEVAKKIGEAYRALDMVEKKKYKDDARIAMDKFKADHPDLPKTTRKKKKQKKGEEEEDDAVIANDVVAVVEKEKGANDDEEEEEEKDRPKKPLNGYMMFSSEVRLKVKEDNPDASPKEIMSLIGKEYRALDDDERNQYKTVAGAAMAKFKEEHGENALKNQPRKSKKLKKRSSINGGGNHPTGDNLANIPSKPAEGLPDGWVTRNVPRKAGDRADMYWFSPEKSFKFRSKAEVKRFQSSFEKADGDEGAAMELYTKGEKKEKSVVAAAGSESVKKRTKRNSGKKNDAASVPAAVDGDGSVKDDGRAGGQGEKKEKSVKKKRKRNSGKKNDTAFAAATTASLTQMNHSGGHVKEEEEEVPEAWEA